MAVAHAYNLSFEDAQAVCARFGREKYRGMPVGAFMDMIYHTFGHCTELVGVFGYTLVGNDSFLRHSEKTGEIPPTMKGMTLDTFINKHNTGTYIVAMRNHVTVVKNGKILS